MLSRGITKSRYGKTKLDPSNNEWLNEWNVTIWPLLQLFDGHEKRRVDCGEMVKWHLVALREHFQLTTWQAFRHKWGFPHVYSASLGRIGAEDRHEPNDPPVLVLYRVRVCALLSIRYSIRAVQQDSTFKITHIEKNPSIFGWDMTKNILFPFWVIAKGWWILLKYWSF